MGPRTLVVQARPRLPVPKMAVPRIQIGIDLSLFCTYRTPVADMLAHSPPLPLVIQLPREILQKLLDPEDEAGIMLALHTAIACAVSGLDYLFLTCRSFLRP